MPIHESPVDLQICLGCCARFTDPVVEPPVGGTDAPVPVCAECGRRRPYRRLPLFALTGPSGAGSSTVARLLPGGLADVAVVVEQDVLWTAGLQDPADDFAAFRRAWLRVAALSTSGRPVVLVGSVGPEQFERRPERAVVGEIPTGAGGRPGRAPLQPRRARPARRGWDEPRIAEAVRFDDWLRRTAPTLDPPVELLDTTRRALDETAHRVVERVRRGRARTPER